jgi:hypothetical protein
MIFAANFKWEKDNVHIICRIRAKVAYFEDELPKLKEITLILKLSLWKSSRMNNASLFQKKIKTDKSSIKK